MSTHILLFSSYHLDIFEIVYMLCIYVCMFAYMWALMCECGGLRLTRAMLGIFLDCSPHCLLRWGLSLNLNLAFASALDSQLASEMPYLLPKDCDYWQAIMPTNFCVGSGIQTQVQSSGFFWQALYLLGHLHSPIILFFASFSHWMEAPDISQFCPFPPPT